MGSAASKPVKSAAGAAARQYPKQAAPPPRPAHKAPKGPKAPTPASQPKASAPPRAPAPPAAAPSSQGPTYHSKEKASSVKSDAIDMDGRDPDFAASLRSIGPVNPNPTFSNSSAAYKSSKPSVFPQASNPALLVVSARQRLNEAAEHEAESFARSGSGRTFLDPTTIQQILTMRDQQNQRPREIERFLGLRKGVLDRLGKTEVVSRIA